MQYIQAMHRRDNLAVHVIKLHEVQTVLVIRLIDLLARVRCWCRVGVRRSEWIDLLHCYTIGGIGGCGLSGGISNGVISGITGRCTDGVAVRGRSIIARSVSVSTVVPYFNCTS